MANKILLPSNYPPIDPEIRRRLEALERSKYPGLDLIGDSGFFSVTNQAPSSTDYQDVAVSHVPFTLVKPSRVIIKSSACFYISDTGGGPFPNYCFVLHSLDDLSLQSVTSGHTHNAGLSNHTGESDDILPAGTYTAQMWFYVDTNYAGALFNIFQARLRVFQVG